MMQKSGALAVIIGNYIENPGCMIQALGRDEDLHVRIPAVLIQRLDYLALLKLVQDQKGEVHIRLVRNEESNSYLEVFLLAFVWPCTMLGIFCLTVHLHNAWTAYKKNKESEYAVSHTKSRIFQADGHEEIWCCICLEFYQNGDQVKYLRCNHIYHESCIDEWFYYSSFCPLCKVKVF
jgi:hypothetical protein